ncbi:FabD/lysophospholipase-like protein, partial [Mycena crocata]
LIADAGGIRGTSILVILKEIFSRNLPGMQPCEYFDIIAGSGTGGIIALMLGRLRMTINDTLLAYEAVCADFFADAERVRDGSQYDETTFETLIKRVVRDYSVSEDADEKMEDPKSMSGSCRTFVCARKVDVETGTETPVLLRTYETSTEPAATCTIWEAARATTAFSTFFKSILIGSEDKNETLIDGGIGCYNPTPIILQEAADLFPNRQVEFIINIGTGRSATLYSTSECQETQFPAEFVQGMTQIADNCDITADQTVSRFRRTPRVYFRYQVAGINQPVQVRKWDNIKQVTDLVRLYFQVVDLGMIIQLS